MDGHFVIQFGTTFVFFSSRVFSCIPGAQYALKGVGLIGVLSVSWHNLKSNLYDRALLRCCSCCAAAGCKEPPSCVRCSAEMER